MKKGLLMIVLAGMLACMGSRAGGLVPVSAAEVSEMDVQTAHSEWVNPLYADVVVTDTQSSQPEGTVESTGTNTYTTKKAAAAYIRRQMKARQESIAFNYKGSGLGQAALAQLQEELLDQALEVTSSPQEGDYLRYHLSYISRKYTYSWEGTESYIVWNVSYMTTAEEENAAIASIKRAVKELNLSQESDAMKIKLIHDSICKRVVYVDDGSTTVHSAYGAIEQGRAVCQGYATLFYAMGMEAGLKVRCVEGTGNGGAHLWNIVKLGDSWYNMDVTWDDQMSGISYKYYMKNNADFGNHISSGKYLSSSFFRKHPIAGTSYTGEVEIPVFKKVASAGANSVKLVWNQVPSAAGYMIYVSNSKNGVYSKLDTVKGGVTEKKISGLVPGKKYFFKLCAYGTMFDKVSSAYSNVKAVKPVPAQVKVKRVAASKKALRVTWKKVQGAQGYQVTVSYKKGKKTVNKQVIVKAAGKASQAATIKNLPSGKKCSVRVRAYAAGTKGKVFGANSKIVKKTVK